MMKGFIGFSKYVTLDNEVYEPTPDELLAVFSLPAEAGDITELLDAVARGAVEGVDVARLRHVLDAIHGVIEGLGDDGRLDAGESASVVWHLIQAVVGR